MHRFDTLRAELAGVSARIKALNAVELDYPSAIRRELERLYRLGHGEHAYLLREQRRIFAGLNRLRRNDAGARTAYNSGRTVTSEPRNPSKL